MDLYYDMVPAVACGDGEAGAFLHRGKPADGAKRDAGGLRAFLRANEFAFSSQIDSSAFVTLTVREEDGPGSFNLPHLAND